MNKKNIKKVYISTGGIKNIKIIDLIKLFIRKKIYDLELSGGEKLVETIIKSL